MEKKIRKGYGEFLLKKGEEEISVICPEKIKLSSGQVYLQLGWGLPPLDVKPVDKKGLIIVILAFLGIFVACTFFTVSVGLGILFLAGILVFNFIYTKNYYYNYIKKQLENGFVPANEQTETLIKQAGLLGNPVTAGNVNNNSYEKPAPQVDITEQLEKLAGLLEKGILTKEEFDAQKQKLLNK